MLAARKSEVGNSDRGKTIHPPTGTTKRPLFLSTREIDDKKKVVSQFCAPHLSRPLLESEGFIPDIFPLLLVKEKPDTASSVDRKCKYSRKELLTQFNDQATLNTINSKRT